MENQGQVVSAGSTFTCDVLFERERAQNELNNSQKQGRENHPGHKENANCIVFHARRGGLVGIGDTRAGDEEGGE
jgi:hypothetical protein